MTRTIKAICVLIGLFCALNSFMPKMDEKSEVLAKEREVKAVWAATVFSLDYPAEKTSDSDILAVNIDRLVEEVHNSGYNTLFFQVRPAADAFYKSEVYPWSRYLTGTEGLAPDNDFDPLEYLVTKAHEKGIEVHAWLNPYRITASEKDNDKLSEGSVAKKYPNLTVKYTDGKLYLNPGEPETNKLVIEGAAEIARGYAVDGIHIDDYFYPGSDFPDGETFTKYGGAFADIGDWRRNNITDLVKGMRDAVKAERADIVFSVSPCGIWANKQSNPDGSDTKGAQAYYDYYADTRLWVKEGYVDWILPQVYWNIGNAAADFEEVVRWWNDTAEGAPARIVVGQGVYRASDETNSGSVWYGESGINELKRQTEILRGLKNVSGYAHYRLGSVMASETVKGFAADINKSVRSTFSDTKDYPWAQDAIEMLYEKGIANGMGDGTFGCARNVSRADFTLMITRMMGKAADFSENFADVTADKYYYKEIGIAKALGYASGRGDNIFDPEGNITRQDMATLAYRILKSEGKTMAAENISLGAKFSDADEISEYAREAVKAMLNEGYLSGYETGEFRPQGFATRAETAVFLNNILKDK